MPVDRTHIRVKSMLIAPNREGTAHAVSVNGATPENPLGYHRFVGGSVELGETHRDALIREVREELNADVLDLTYLGCIENIFQLAGELGHEIVFMYSGLLDPLPAPEGGTLTEADGSVLPLVWRREDDPRALPPLYPQAATDLVRAGLATHRS